MLSKFVQLQTNLDWCMQIAIGAPDIVTGLLTLASSDSNEVQTCSAHCLARFAAWQGATQVAICTTKNAEVMLCIWLPSSLCLPLPLTLPVCLQILWRACFLNNKTAAGALKASSWFLLSSVVPYVAYTQALHCSNC